MLATLRKNKLITLFFISVLFFLLFITLYSSGIIADEGLIMEGVERMRTGQLIYRDFFSWITPGIYYLLYGVWSFTGPSYPIARYLTVFIGFICAILLYKDSRLLLNRFWSALAVGAFVVLFYPNQLIVSYHWVVLIFILLGVWWLERYWQQPRESWLMLSGSSLALAMFTMHTRGLVAFITIIIFLLFFSSSPLSWRENIRRTLWFGLSGTMLFTLLMLPFLLTAGWTTLWQDLVISNLVYYPRIGYIPLQTNAILFFALSVYLLLWFMLWKHRLFNRIVIFYYIMSLALLLSAIYRLDTFHLAYTYGVFALPLTFFVWQKMTVNVTNIVLAGLLFSAPLYAFFPSRTELYVNYRYWRPISTKIGPLYLLRGYDHKIGSVLRALEKIPEPEVFILPNAPHYYSLAAKRNPTRYSLIMVEYLAPAELMEIKNTLLAKNIRYVLYAPLIINKKLDQGFLRPWLLEHYNETKIKYDYLNDYFYLYEKK